MSDFYRSQGFREDATDHLRLAAQVRADCCECRNGLTECVHRKAGGPKVDQVHASQDWNEATAAAANHSDCAAINSCVPLCCTGRQVQQHQSWLVQKMQGGIGRSFQSASAAPCTATS